MQLKGWPFEPFNESEPLGSGEGPGPPIPG